ncbi:hypothetical protein CAPTEDRAFT_195605 [Capitella teleta]|uniref:G-protein coupled receptors family 1 profile domain-containing protein n=1 Tax=Capitella teleta TaxID=283909 RepID=R7UHB9_CAPTE|nr:hypothetical protein CAPTEDRAFT_195605 [Capitella teleta]|eukprot:ELU03208.1 hypothetical protein CAPTEDRAFT_195605 [Capitella teleta]
METTMGYARRHELFKKVFLGFELPAILFVVFTNLLVLWFIRKMHTKKQCPHNVHYIVSLSVANLFAGAMALPVSILSNFTNIQGDLFCRASHYLLHVVEFAEVYSLVGLAVDRYQVMISNRIDGTSNSKVPRFVGVVLIWLSSLIYGVPYSFIYKERLIRVEVDRGQEITFTACSPIHKMTLTKLLILVDAVVVFCLPLIIIAIAYLFLVLHVDRESQQNSSKKVLKTVLVLILVFIIFDLPLLIFNTYILYGPGDILHQDIIQEVLELVAFLNFGINAIVYALMRANFKTYWELLPKCVTRIHPQESVRNVNTDVLEIKSTNNNTGN